MGGRILGTIHYVYKQLLQNSKICSNNKTRGKKNSFQVISSVTHTKINVQIWLLLCATNSILEAKPPYFSKVVYAPDIGEARWDWMMANLTLAGARGWDVSQNIHPAFF